MKRALRAGFVADRDEGGACAGNRSGEERGEWRGEKRGEGGEGEGTRKSA